MRLEIVARKGPAAAGLRARRRRPVCRQAPVASRPRAAGAAVAAVALVVVEAELPADRGEAQGVGRRVPRLLVLRRRATGFAAPSWSSIVRTYDMVPSGIPHELDHPRLLRPVDVRSGGDVPEAGVIGRCVDA